MSSETKFIWMQMVFEDRDTAELCRFDSMQKGYVCTSIGYTKPTYSQGHAWRYIFYYRERIENYEQTQER